MDRFSLTIPGQPVPWARAGRNGKRSFTPPAQKRYQDRVRLAWLQAGRPRVDGALTISMRAYFERPRSHYRTGRYSHLLRPDAPPHMTTKPDVENIFKGCLDALNGLAFLDDALIVCWSGVSKHYGEPRVDLDVWATPTPVAP